MPLRSLNLNVSITTKGNVIEIETMDGVKLQLIKDAALHLSSVNAIIHTEHRTPMNGETIPNVSAALLFDLLSDLVS